MKGVSNVNLNAENIEYNSETVKDKLDGLSTDVSSRVLKSGDTMSGGLTIDQQNGTTSSVNYSVLTLGNSIPEGTDKNSVGLVDFYGRNNGKVRLYPANITGTQYLTLPDKSGIVAIVDDIPDLNASRKDQTGYTFYSLGNLIIVRLVNFTGGSLPITLVDDFAGVQSFYDVDSKDNIHINFQKNGTINVLNSSNNNIGSYHIYGSCVLVGSVNE